MTSASHCSAKYLGVEMTTTRHSMFVSNTKQPEFGDICPESTDAGLRPKQKSASENTLPNKNASLFKATRYIDKRS